MGPLIFRNNLGTGINFLLSMHIFMLPFVLKVKKKGNDLMGFFIKMLIKKMNFIKMKS